jgi:osmotically-inducible protein OsmY
VTIYKEFDGQKRTIVLSIAICAFALLSGCQRPQSTDDAAITKSVKAKLSAVFGPIEDRQVRQFDRGANGQTITYISVSSTNGVVTLTGEVGNKKALAKAGEIARGVQQVVRVNNNISLAPGYSDDAVDDKP